MTLALAQKRRAEAAWIAAAAAVSVVLALLVFGLDARSRMPPQSPGLVAPALAARPQSAEVILVATRDATYRLAKGPRGWTMNDRGGYPLRQEAVAGFTRALAAMRYGRPMTRDPAKHARLGLDDPRKGGGGALVQVQDAQGALLASVIIGAVGDARYARADGAEQTWTLLGDLPPYRDASAWLDLRPLAVPEERIARVDVARTEAMYAILRGEGGGFVLARPFSERPLIEPARIARVATILGALDPVDVAPAPAMTGAPEARAVLQTLDGLLLDAELFRRDGRAWLRLGARASDPARAPEAAEINRRAGPWAFALTEEEAADVAPPIADLVRLPAPKPVAEAAPAPVAAAPTAPAPPTTDAP